MRAVICIAYPRKLVTSYWMEVGLSLLFKAAVTVLATFWCHNCQRSPKTGQWQDLFKRVSQIEVEWSHLIDHGNVPKSEFGEEGIWRFNLGCTFVSIHTEKCPVVFASFLFNIPSRKSDSVLCRHTPQMPISGKQILRIGQATTLVSRPCVSVAPCCICWPRHHSCAWSTETKTMSGLHLGRLCM